MSVFYKIFISLLILFSGKNLFGDEFRLSLTNISDYKVSFVIVSLENDIPVDELPPIKADLAVGQTIDFSVPKELRYDVIFSTEDNQLAYELSSKYSIEGCKDLAKGFVYTIGGFNNYVFADPYRNANRYFCEGFDGRKGVKVISLVEAIRGSDLPTNPNPLDGASDLIEGVSSMLIGTAKIVRFFRQNKVNVYLSPEEEMQKYHIGLRVEVKNLNSRIFPGIEGNVRPFKETKYKISRLSTKK